LISVDQLTEAGFMVSFHRDYFEIYHV